MAKPILVVRVPQSHSDEVFAHTAETIRRVCPDYNVIVLAKESGITVEAMDGCAKEVQVDSIVRGEDIVKALTLNKGRRGSI